MFLYLGAGAAGTTEVICYGAPDKHCNEIYRVPHGTDPVTYPRCGKTAPVRLLGSEAYERKRARALAGEKFRGDPE